MHIFLMTRGIQRQVTEWEHLMQAARFPWKRTNLTTGKEEIMLLQGSLRPIQLWEYVIPEDCLNEVLSSQGITGPIERQEIRALAWTIRKMLHLEQIPVIKEPIVTGYRPRGTLNGEPMPNFPVHNMFVEGVAVYPIGIRRDIVQDADWGVNGKYKQEMI